jgi:hypothetical protein
MASAGAFFLENSAVGRTPVPDLARLQREFVVSAVPLTPCSHSIILIGLLSLDV